VRKWLARCVGLVLVGVLGAAEPGDAVLRETWDAAYLQTSKAGFVHTTVRESGHNGRKVLKTEVELDLTVRRFQDTVRLRMETGTEETPAGKVTAVSMRQFLGKEQQLSLRGTVEGDTLCVKVDGGRRLDKKVSWNDEVIGLYRQERLFRERRVKPGDRFSYLTYEPTVTAVVTTRVAVKDYEEVEFPGAGKRRLLRVETKADKIGGVQLPPLTVWLDSDLMPVRSQVDMPGLGMLTLYRTTRAQALRQDGTPRINIGVSQLIRLNRRIPRPYDTETAVYRIAIKGDTDPGTTFAQDDRQQVTSVLGNTFELRVKARRGPERTARPGEVGPEFLQSCYFINSDDAKVRELARRAVGPETDPWEKAKRIEKWVHLHMDKKNFSEAFATADHVARTLEGDCTEHAVLAAAMCRAAGVPSRAAVGLLYVDTAQGPAFGFHMWAEVWVRGQWLPIDATLGRGYVGATHLKISDHSWHETASLTPLLPVLRVVGKAAIEVVRVDGPE
jgi:transglutaminase-like putative cysteine protease